MRLPLPRLTPAAVALGLFLAGSSLAQTRAGEALFNGRNLQGWRHYLADHSVARSDVWSVQDGLLVCRGEPMGYLYTTREFTNFRLTVEWRWTPGKKPGNSGVLFRINGQPQPLPRCYEAQLASGSAGDLYGFQDQTLSGDAARSIDVPNHNLGGHLTGVRKMSAQENTPGEWNTYDIVVEGSSIQVSVNGTLVNQATAGEIVAGPIGLQSEGGEIQFRKVEITPLADTAGAWIPLFNGRNLDGWKPKIRTYEYGNNFADTFRVVDGLLTVAYDGYDNKFDNRFGHLFYQHPYSNYLLRVEYRFVGDQMPDGAGWAFRNSGIMIHGQAPETMRLNQDFPVSIEVQLLGGRGSGNRTTANLCTPGTHVVMADKLITQHCTESTSKTYDGDQWVTVELEVHGNQIIQHLIDGETVLAYSQAQLDDTDADAKRLLEAGAPRMISGGSISLQSESHPVQFRKVELLPLAN